MSAIVERRTRKRYKAAAASGLVAAVYGAVSWADTLPFLSATIWMTIIFSPAMMGLIAVIRIAPDVGGKVLHLHCLYTTLKYHRCISIEINRPVAGMLNSRHGCMLGT